MIKLIFNSLAIFYLTYNYLMMKILGVDPSIRSAGWAVIKVENNNKNIYVASDTLYLNPAESVATRLGKFYKKMAEIITEYLPNVVGLESIFLNKDLSSVLKLSYVRGILMSIVGQRNLDLVEVSPLQVKKSVTGRGISSKESVKKMLDHIISIPQGVKIRTFDESDAIAIAYSAGIIKSQRLK